MEEVAGSDDLEFVALEGLDHLKRLEILRVNSSARNDVVFEDGIELLDIGRVEEVGQRGSGDLGEETERERKKMRDLEHLKELERQMGNEMAEKEKDLENQLFAAHSHPFANKSHSQRITRIRQPAKNELQYRAAKALAVRKKRTYGDDDLAEEEAKIRAQITSKEAELDRVKRTGDMQRYADIYRSVKQLEQQLAQARNEAKGSIRREPPSQINAPPPSQDRINPTSDNGPGRSLKLQRLITRKTTALRKSSVGTVVAKLKNAPRAYIGLAIILIMVYEVMGSFYGRSVCYRRPQDGTRAWITHCWYETYAVSLMLCPLVCICCFVSTVLDDWRASIAKGQRLWNEFVEAGAPLGTPFTMAFFLVSLCFLYLLFFLLSKSM
jgi:hypothetical protein